MASYNAATIRSFNRYELKYVIHASRIDALVNDVKGQMTPDRNGDERGSYIVSNLYYDSADLHMLNSKIVGSNYRRKLRVRLYGEPGKLATESAMVEIKQRLGRTTQKRRVVQPLEDALRLCDGHGVRLWEDPVDLEVAEEIRSLVLALQLRPVCSISYRRRAFVGSSFEPNLRLTFDSDLWATPPRLDFADDGQRTYLIPRDWVILEIKVDERVPLWITELVARHDCQLRRMSKYCLGIAKLRGLQIPVPVWPSEVEVSSPPLTALAPRSHLHEVQDEAMSAMVRNP